MENLFVSSDSLSDICSNASVPIEVEALLAAASTGQKTNETSARTSDHDSLDGLNDLNEVAIAELSRETLDDDNSPLSSRDQLQIRLKELFGFEAKDGQLTAIQTLQEHRDAILIAKTGYGKSMIFQAMSVLNVGAITILIYPLNALEEDQSSAIARIPGARPIILNSDKLKEDPKVIQRVAEGHYTHILTGPEMILNNMDLRRAIQSPVVKSRLALVAIDEVHLVRQWEWRKSYARLGELRSIVSRQVPFFATSATLSMARLEEIKSMLRFQSTVTVIREELDRPEIFINAQSIESSATSFEDLRFLVEDLDALKKRKIIVYGDSRKHLRAMKCKLVDFCIELGETRVYAESMIRAYNGRMSKGAKKRLMTEFEKPDSCIKIVCATDALGLGMNISDIDVVVQWKAPPDIESLLQRFGRAARGKNKHGEAIWFYQKSLRGDRCQDTVDKRRKGPGPSRLREVINANELDDATISETERERLEPEKAMDPEKKKKLKQTQRQVRASMDDCLWRIINESGCKRIMMLEALDATLSEIDTVRLLNYENGCCSFHTSDGGSTILIAKSKKPKKKYVAPKANAPQRAAIVRQLIEWRDRLGPIEFAGTIVARERQFEIFLSEKDHMIDIARDATEIKTADDFKKIAQAVGWDPEWIERYAEELTRLIVRAISDAPSKRNWNTNIQIAKARKTAQTAKPVETASIAATSQTELSRAESQPQPRSQSQDSAQSQPRLDASRHDLDNPDHNPQNGIIVVPEPVSPETPRNLIRAAVLPATPRTPLGCLNPNVITPGTSPTRKRDRANSQTSSVSIPKKTRSGNTITDRLENLSPAKAIYNRRFELSREDLETASSNEGRSPRAAALRSRLAWKESHGV